MALESGGIRVADAPSGLASHAAWPAHACRAPRDGYVCACAARRPGTEPRRGVRSHGDARAVREDHRAVWRGLDSTGLRQSAAGTRSTQSLGGEPLRLLRCHEVTECSCKRNPHGGAPSKERAGKRERARRETLSGNAGLQTSIGIRSLIGHRLRSWRICFASQALVLLAAVGQLRQPVFTDVL
jgi:hypothetical protein